MREEIFNERVKGCAGGWRCRGCEGMPAPTSAPDVAAPARGEDPAARAEGPLSGAALVTAVLERFDGRLLEPEEAVGLR